MTGTSDISYPLQALQAMLLHEDDHILVFNKPSGLSVQSGRGQHQTLDDMLAAMARPNGKRPKLVHRLDRGTSGVLVVAKTQPAAAHLGRSFMHRKARKTYWAAVSGCPDPLSGTIRLALRRTLDGRQHIMVTCADDHAEAEAASTTYRVLGRGAGCALIECRPHSGRMHQIRVHMQSLGAPLLGDALYGGDMGAARLHLHARRLEIPHPAGGALDITAPVPDDLRLVWQDMGILPAEDPA